MKSIQINIKVTLVCQIFCHPHKLSHGIYETSCCRRRQTIMSKQTCHLPDICQYSYSKLTMCRMNLNYRNCKTSFWSVKRLSECEMEQSNQKPSMGWWSFTSFREVQSRNIRVSSGLSLMLCPKSLTSKEIFSAIIYFLTSQNVLF